MWHAGSRACVRVPMGRARRVHGRQPDDPGAVDQLRTDLQPGAGATTESPARRSALWRCRSWSPTCRSRSSPPTSIANRGFRFAAGFGALLAGVVRGGPRTRRSALRARAARHRRGRDRPALPAQRLDHAVLAVVPALAARDRGQPDHPGEPHRCGHRDGLDADAGEVDVDLEGPADLRRRVPWSLESSSCWSPATGRRALPTSSRHAPHATLVGVRQALRCGRS